MEQVDAAVVVSQPDNAPAPREHRRSLPLSVVAVAPALCAAVSTVVALVELGTGHVTIGPAVLAVICFAATVTAILQIVIFWRAGRRELRTIKIALATVAGGNWTRVDPNTTQLFPGLAECANALIDRFRQTIRLVARSSVALSSGRNGIHDVSEQISSTAESTAGQATGAAAIAEQVANSVRMVAHSSDGLVSKIGTVAEHAADVLRVTGSATEQGQRAVELVSTLIDASRQIEEAIGLVATIAGQTRTLAFNATIEAVRAGEAGSGFAVVAGEVRALAQTTATATSSIGRSIQAIQEGADQAESAIGVIVETIKGIAGTQTAVARAVEEQTETTGEIQHSAADAASGTLSIVDSIRDLANATRVTASAGAQIRTTSGALALIGDDLAKILIGFDVDSLVDELQAYEPERPDAPTAIMRDGVTVVEDTVQGSGEAEFDYIGDWSHSEANVETGGSNSYNITPDDVVKLRFTGTKVRFYSVTGPNHGIGAASVDDGEERLLDMYSAERTAEVLLFESSQLRDGQHVLTIRVTGQWNPQSRYGWVTIDRAEFE